MPAATDLTTEAHRAAVIDWWAQRDERLRDPDGWLTLVGLHWLGPGENQFGADASNDIVLSGEDVPAHAGSLWLRDGEVRLQPDGEAEPRPEPLASDVAGEPTVIQIGSLHMYVIERGQRWGLRVRDHASPKIAGFRGMDHFPIDASWRIQGRLRPAEDGERLEIVDVTGDIGSEETPGTVEFERAGRTWSLAALPGDADERRVWLVFGDMTNGLDTYGGGRFLYSEPVADDGNVVLDFNLAYNPPCVFSEFATCPLPPPQNRLNLRIEAGERNYRPEVAG
jgi:uncharacterized protein (DUF1684 family)